jgi:hypothetical protein
MSGFVPTRKSVNARRRRGAQNRGLIFGLLTIIAIVVQSLIFMAPAEAAVTLGTQAVSVVNASRVDVSVAVSNSSSSRTVTSGTVCIYASATSGKTTCTSSSAIASGYTSSPSGLPVAKSSTGTMSYSFTGLSLGTGTYYIVATATDSNGNTASSVSSNFAAAVATSLAAASSIANTTATLNATIITDGAQSVAWSFCYATVAAAGSTLSNCASATPVTGSTSSATTSTAIFSNLSGLAPGTQYVYQLKATYGSTSIYTGSSTFTTTSPFTVSTSSATSITSGGASLSSTLAVSNGTSTTYKLCYSTSSSLNSCASATVASTGSTTSSSKTVSATLTGLASGTKYYYILEGTQGSTVIATTAKSFTTTAINFTVNATAATNVTSSAAALNGNIAVANSAATTWQFCYKAASSLTSCTGATMVGTAGSSTASATTTVTANLTGLAMSTQYTYLLQGTQSGVVVSSTSQSFTTQAAFSVGSSTATSVGSIGATLNGSVSSIDGASTTLDFCYSTSSSLASCAGGTVTTISAGTSTATSSSPVSAAIGGLTSGSTYYYQLRGTRAAGTVYSAVLSFTATGSGLAVASSPATSIATTSAVLNATVTPNSTTATTVTFCYSTSPLLASCSATGVKTVAIKTSYTGSTASKVSTTISGLTAGTAYFYQVKATQGSTVIYSSPLKNFTTLGGAVSASAAAYAITSSSATLAGTATANGSAAAVAFCYSSSSTLANCATTDAQSVGFASANESPLDASASNAAVTSQISNGLTAQTTYYFQMRTTNGAGTSYGAVSSFTTIGTPFLCNTNFYQVSATAPQLWVFNPQSKLFSTTGANTKSGLNGLAYDALNNYMYVMNGTTLYQVDSAGAFTALGSVSGAQSIGASFIGASHKLLATNGSGSFSIIDVSRFPLTSTPFSVTTASGSSAWGSADLAVVPSGAGYTAYGMSGSTLNILAIAGATATSGVVTSRTVVSGTSGQTIPSGAYGAAYPDRSGDVFFFNNGNSQMWEISAIELARAAANPLTNVTATLVTTASPKLSAANDGASCPLSASPFDPPQPIDDTYSITAAAGASLDIHGLGQGFTYNDQSGTTFQVDSITYGATTQSTTGPITSSAGTLNITDLAQGNFTFTPASQSTQSVSFTYRLIQTNVTSPQVSTSYGTVTINVVQPQVVSWSPTTSLSTTQSGQSVIAASSTGGGAITYAIVPSATNSAGCAINPTTGVLSFVVSGTCSAVASAAATSSYSAATGTPVLFTIGLAAQAISWTVPQSFQTSESPVTFDSGAVSSGDGTISYSVASGDAGTTACSVNANTGVLTFTAAGTCTVTVNASATATYAAATPKKFVFSIGTPQTVLWSTPSSTSMLNTSFTPTAATSSPSGATITYVVTDAGTSGCSLANASSPIFTYSAAGTCTIAASAANRTVSTITYSSATQVQSFEIALVPQVVSWIPATTAFTMTQSPATLTAATAYGSPSITYAVSSQGTSDCSIANPASPALTFTVPGSCVVVATAAQTTTYLPASSSPQTFLLTLAPQTVSWSPTTAILVTSSPRALPIGQGATSSSGGSISYAVTDPGVTGCSVNLTTGELYFTAIGNCTVQASTPQTSRYSGAVSTPVVFVIGLAPSTLTWAPTLSVAADPAGKTFTPIPATTTSDGAVTYALGGSGAGATGCSVNPTTGAVAYTGTGFSSTANKCQVTVSVAATSRYSAPTPVSVNFSITQIPNVVAWTPTTLNPVRTSSSFTTAVTAASAISGTVSYTSTAPSYSGNVTSCTMSSGTLTVASTSTVSSGTTIGTCTLTASSSALAEGANGWYSASNTARLFTVTTSALGTQSLTWLPATAVTASTSKTFTPSSLASVTSPVTGGGAVTYAVTDPGATSCAVNASSGIVTYASAGTCVVTATAAANASYSATSTPVSFVISRATPVFSAGPAPTSLTMLQSVPYAYAAWTSTSDAPVTYALASTGNTIGCSAALATPNLSFTQAGTCSLHASVGQTNLYNAASTGDVTFTIGLAPQTVTWAPTVSLTATPTRLGFTPTTMPSTDGDGAISYSVSDPGATGCTVNPTTGEVTYTASGTCVVVATAAQTSRYAVGTRSISFVISKAAQTVTWAPQASYVAVSGRIFAPSISATSTGPGTISYGVTNAGTASCAVNSATGLVSYATLGTCEITATAASTGLYSGATKAITFTVTPATQTISWAPSTGLNVVDSPVTVTSTAVTLGGAPIAYAVGNYSTLTCSINAATPTLTFAGPGYCSAIATAAAYGIYGSAETTVTFEIAGPPAADSYAVSDATATGATFNGAVSSDGLDTTASFCISTSSTLRNCSTSDSVAVSTALASPSLIAASDTTSEWVTLPVVGTLAPATTYYFQTMAENSYGRAYGSVLSFTTPSRPRATTVDPTAISANSSTAQATLAGSVDSQYADTAVIFCYSRSATLSDCVTSDSSAVTTTSSQTLTAVTRGAQSMTTSVSGLALGATYYYAVKAVNSVGTTFGAVKSFVTPSLPSVTTLPALEFQSSGAILQASAESHGETTTVTMCVSTTNVVVAGVLQDCYTTLSTSPSTIPGSTTGVQTVIGNLPGILTGTYYFQAIATSAVGTVYGSVIDLDPGAPNVGVSQPTSVTTTSAQLVGSVNPEANATNAWFCYSTSGAYVAGTGALQSCTVTGTVSFGTSIATPQSMTTAVSGLSPNTTYYVQVQAHTDAIVVANQPPGGVSVYSAIIPFTTPGPPTVSTDSASAIAASSADVNATVNAGGASTSVGFCVGLLSDLSDCVSYPVVSPVTGFTSTSVTTHVTGLSPMTRYYYRAAASNANSSGSGSLGSVLSFVTLAKPTVATTGSVVRSTGVTLSGTVNANGDATSVIYFCYSSDSAMSECYSLASTVFTQGASPTSAAGTSNVAVQSVVPAGLPAGTYYYQVGATNSSGSSYSTPLRSFVIPLITQITPLSGTVTAPNEPSFSAQLATSGNTGAVTYAQASSTYSSNILVSSSGRVTIASSGLHVGTYIVNGSMTDASGGVGTWQYTLTITAATILQSSSAHGDSTVAALGAFADSIITSGSDGRGVTFTETLSANSSKVVVSASGAIRVVGSLAPGAYSVSGTMEDASGDTGTWGYTLYVHNGALTQAAPTSAATRTPSGFTAQLTAVGGDGNATASTDAQGVSYTQTAGNPAVAVSSRGVITTSGVLAVGTYIASGTMRDISGDLGTWSFTLRVIDGTLTQTSTTKLVIPKSSTPFVFSSQLVAAGADGMAGATTDSTGVSYSQNTGSADLNVSSAGVITATRNLAIGGYIASGSMLDSSGDAGAWTVSVFVIDGTLVQLEPKSGLVNAGDPLSDQLEMTGSDGGDVTYTQFAGSASVSVDSAGAVTTATTLAPGVYTATGSASDATGNIGPWTYTVTVSALATSPGVGSVTVADSRNFTQTLTTTDETSTAVTATYAKSQGNAAIQISSSGDITLTSTLAVGTYVVQGTTSAPGKTGTFTYTLTVTDGAPLATTPTSSSLTVAQSAALSVNLATSGNTSSSTVTYTRDSSGQSSELLLVGAHISSTGTLAVGSYSVTGRTRDTLGETGTFSYILTVTRGSNLSTTPTTGETTVANSRNFSAALSTSGNTGGVSVAYVQTTGSADVLVSEFGRVSAARVLAVGSYTATGTTSDAWGETGTFTYTLTVTDSAPLGAAPTASSVTVAGSYPWAGVTLIPTGNTANSVVTFTRGAGQSSSLSFTNGVITTTQALAVGTYTASGTLVDALGETGTFSYTLTVTNDAPLRTTPSGASITVAQSASWAGASLATTGNKSGSTVSYTRSLAGQNAELIFSNGALSVSNALPVGSYVASGTTRDALGETGVFSYTLTVTDGSPLRTTPAEIAIAVTNTNGFTRQLSTSGNTASSAVSYSKTAGNSNITVSSAGLLRIAASLPVGSYVVSGTTSDLLGETGTFSVTITVYNLVTTPGTGTVSSVRSTSFTEQLATSNTSGSLTYTQATGSSSISVGSSGAITVPSALSAGTYTATGGVTDGAGRMGTYSYVLTVTAGALSTTPTAGITDVNGSKAFTQALATTGETLGSTVSYTKTSGDAELVVSSLGVVSTNNTTLHKGTYTIAGTTDDLTGNGITGTFSYTLTVSANALTTTPTGPVTIVYSQWGTWTVDLHTVGGLAGSNFTYTRNTSETNRLVVSSGGRITTTGQPSDATFFASGSVTDQYGNYGTWSYTLIDPVGTLVTTPGSRTVIVADSGAASTSLATTGNYGAVTYTKASGSASLQVSTTGVVTSVDGTMLTPGDYSITVDAIDQRLDTGQSTFVLHVVAGALTSTTSTGTVSTSASSAFGQNLAVSGSPAGASLSYSLLVPNSRFAITSGGRLTTTAAQAANAYQVYITVTDNYGDSGTFLYTLTVTPVSLATTPTANAGTVNVGASGTFSQQLATTGNSGTAVTYVKTGGSNSLSVSGTGLVSTSGTLPIGTYTATGTTTDALGDSGTFSYTLTITDVPGLQIRNLTVTTAPNQPTAIVGTPIAMLPTLSVGTGAITWSAGPANVCSISADGIVTSLGAGECTVIASTPATGTYYAAAGSFVLTIAAPPGSSSSPLASPSVGGTPSSSPSAGPVAPASGPRGVLLPAPTVTIRQLLGAPSRSGSSVDSIGLPKSESLTELAAETFNGYAPKSGTYVEVVGARTAGQFIVTPGQALDAVTVTQALQESQSRIATDFARINSATAVAAPDNRLLADGTLTKDAAETFKAANLAIPTTVGQLKTGDAKTWIKVSAAVTTFEPGSVVYLTAMSDPVILGAAVVDQFGQAKIDGYLPVDLIGTGGHTIRVVGTRDLEGITTDGNGQVKVSENTLTQIQQFDPGTTATVRVIGANETGGRQVAIREIPLNKDIPWWTLWILLMGVLGALLFHLFSKIWTRRRRISSSAVVAMLTVLPLVTGWLWVTYEVIWLGFVAGIVGQLIVWLFPKRTLRQTAPLGLRGARQVSHEAR